MAWKLEARLVLTDGDLDGAIPIARCAASDAVQALGDRVVADAVGEARVLARTDRLLGRLAFAEAQKLRRIIRSLEADGDQAGEIAGLRVVPGGGE